MVRDWIEIFNESDEMQTPSAGIFAYLPGDQETGSYIKMELIDAH